MRAVVFARNIRVTRMALPPGAEPAPSGGAQDFLITRAEVIEQSQVLLERNLAWEDPRYLVAVAPVQPVPEHPEPPQPDPVQPEPSVGRGRVAQMRRIIAADATPLVARAMAQPDEIAAVGGVRDPALLRDAFVAAPLDAALAPTVVAEPADPGTVVAEPVLEADAGVRAGVSRRWFGRAMRRGDELPQLQLSPHVRDALMTEASAAPDFRMQFDPSLIMPVAPAPVDQGHHNQP